jgi:hypothetical protein
MRGRSKAKTVLLAAVSILLTTAALVQASNARFNLNHLSTTAGVYFELGRSWIAPLQINELTVGMAAAR